MTGLQLTITQTGMSALLNAERTGTNAVRIAAVGFTAKAFEPKASLTALPGEMKRLVTFGGTVAGDNLIHVSIRDEGTSSYAVRGIGLYLQDGRLFAVYAQDEPIVEKSAQAGLVLDVDAAFVGVNVNQVQFGSTQFLNPPATTETLGVVELATVAEALAGVDGQRAITPAAMLAAMNKALASVRRYVPGQIVPIAGGALPDGVLLCNGAAVSRTQYASLFQVIGTTYGAGDGKTTFNLPSIKEGTVITHTNDPNKVGQFTSGQTISHAHAAALTAAGEHAHTTTVLGAGAHGHGASVTAAGDHQHGAWTDQQGWHGHTGSTTVNGEHAHSLGRFIPRYGTGGDAGFHEANDGRVWTNATGAHSHSLYIDGNGAHAHNVGMNSAGSHSHTVSVATQGNHTHAITQAAAGGHSHAITINNTGGTDNLPAGLRMMYCIAY
ncbi:phage tail protein [Lysobacter arvi]|uniref:Phage tail protein n=1 Tax=Lysobacter arvi TaxID=3038776 RepID=A0ABU1CEA7_9GAMM|nr:phage tail protein [Lysobacter arvi]MDR0182407.1 phage tail protein [Lysobacter arvi]